MNVYESLVIRDVENFSIAFQALSSFREFGEFCDVILQADDGIRINAHRVILGACSPYFRAMFSTNFLEARQPIVEIKSVDGVALQHMIDYFYTGEICVDYFNVESIIQLANLLYRDDLKEKCETFLRRKISPKNCLGLRAFGTHYSLVNLSAQAMRYACWYFDDIHREEEFLHLPVEDLKQVLAHDCLKALSEELVLESLLKWFKFDYINRKQHLSSLVPLVRFPLMSLKYLEESGTVKLLVENFALGQIYVNEAKAFQRHELNLGGLDILPKRFTPRSASEDIYVLGGWSNGQKLSTVQCFSVDTLKWVTVNNMTIAHVSKEDYFRVIVSNEELYTICFDRVMKYDPVDVTWLKVADGPGVQCKWAGVCEYDGVVYVVGGNSTRSSKSFDTANLEWRDLPMMNCARYYPGVAVMNGKVYVVGGLDSRWMPLKHCELFDPITKTWNSIARLRSPRWSLGVAVLHDKLYAIGGSHNVEQFANTVEVYDPCSDTWERSNALLNFGRRCLGVAVVRGTIYVVGGRVANTIEAFNEDAGEWKVIGSVQTCCNFGCVALRVI